MRRTKTSDQTHNLPPVVDTQINSRRVILLGVTECGLHQTISAPKDVQDTIPNTIRDVIVNILGSRNGLVQSWKQLSYLWVLNVLYDMSEPLCIT
jgi:hypothetical protein